jgi:hypothetical protein
MSQVASDKSGNVNTNGQSGTYVQIGAVRHYGFDTAITANVTATTAPAGSRAETTNATGRGKIFYSDGTKWQFAAIS